MARRYHWVELPANAAYATYYVYRKADLVEIPNDILADFETVAWREEYAGCGRSREVFYKLDGGYIRIFDFQSWCGDCKERDWPIFMVWNPLWVKYGNGEGMLCLKCFSKRMGRPLTRDDLNDAPCNEIFVTDEDLAACGK